MRLLKTVLWIAAAFHFLNAQQISISGTVKDQASGTGIQGAVVSLTGSGLTTITDKNGSYSFGTAVSTRPSESSGLNFKKPFVTNNSLAISVADEAVPVRVDLYGLSGRLVRTVVDKQLARGKYLINPYSKALSSQPYLLRVRVGNEVTIVKLSPCTIEGARNAQSVMIADNNEKRGSFAKTAAVVDSIIAWAVGYDAGRLNIQSLKGTYDIALSRTVVAGQVQVIQTSQAGDKLAQKPSLAFINDDGAALPTVTVNASTTYQSIVGFGASFTETATSVLANSTAAKRAQVLNAFFNPFTGSGYTLCRTQINSCDFSISSYSYDDASGDYNLNNFNFGHELKWMVPVIKEAMAIHGSNFKLFGSPWSPPAWMKSNNTMLNGGELKADCFSAWALYFVKYINAMKTSGIPIWGLTIQNEPAATQTWESCRFTAQQERDFLKNYLGPTLAKNNIDAKVMIWDHNKDAIVNWAATILGDAAAAKYAWGTAYHRYAGDLFDNLTATHNAFPAFPMVATECSVRETWAEAERMAHEILGDLNHWSGGYLTWNLTTDLAGGPYHNRGNGCVGPIVMDPATGTVNYFGNYYYMTHFSKYLRPDAVRIGCAYSGTDLELTAFKNTNGSIVVVVLNKTNNAVSFKIKQGTQIVKPTIPAHALVDFIY
jgi:glucosylceramidase